MTRRQTKKQAKNIIAGRKVSGVIARYEERAPRTDGTIIITELIPVSSRIVKTVYDIMGGVPCHWDSPFIVDVWQAEGVA